ncbi:CCHC-type domain-containing protein [Trichonephila clavata]|uniref:CCHC-type domain-containing protein n=1 Tax=Trichonephila clavata TaxID=2740835 RepID=A0A8X6I321_TRICU|nr:CCHC-type domain-containing protein [Trichonephila clavata]
MAYLGKARKEDLRLLAEELNLNVGDNMKISDLSKLITTHPDYDEEFSKNQLTIIIEDRKLREQQEIENRRLREQQEMVLKQQEFEKENQRLDREFQLEKLRKTKLLVESNTGTSRGFKPKCFICENVGYLARECPKNTRKIPPRNARSNTITAKRTELESTKEVVTARVSIPVSVPINTRNGIDDLQLVDIKCGQMSIKAVIDTGAQISVLREDLIGKDCGEGEGTIQIISAFGEKEIAALQLFNLKIDDGKHGLVPIVCAV